MQCHFNTLYLSTQGAYLSRDHSNFTVKVDGEIRLRVPLHHLSGVVCFGRVSVSPAVMETMAEQQLALTYLSEQGRFMARLDSPIQGNVLLRREQYRWADDPTRSLAIARPIIAAKIQNCRRAILRAARQTEDPTTAAPLRVASGRLRALLLQLPECSSLNAARGVEGAAARAYFDAFPHLLRQSQNSFSIDGRTRRPPRDPVNAMLSFLYALLRHDCQAALASVGLDPSVGFLHADRPGRPSLALDLMEEFRPLLADALVLSLINRRQVSSSGFRSDAGGAVSMDDGTRRTLVTAYQQRKQDEVRHPLLDEPVRFGLLPHIQARLLARTIRGELSGYPALVLR